MDQQRQMKALLRKQAGPGPWVGFLFFIICFFMAAGTLRGEPQTVRVGVYENAPKVFMDESGRPSGIFIDVLEYVAAKEGWVIEYVPGTWTEGLDRLAEGKIDLMPDVAYTAERSKIYSFHKVPVLSSWYMIYAPRGSNIHSLLDLNKKRILVLDRSVQQAAFDRLSKGFGLDITLIPMPDYKAMFEAVAAGKADAAITNRFYGMRHAGKFGLEDTAVVFEPSDLFFASHQKSRLPLLERMDHHLAEIKKDSQSVYYDSLKRWVSEEVKFRLPLWLQILGLVVAVFLVTSLAASLILKRQVNARTRELLEINHNMEKRITERTAELEIAKTKAESADRLKSAFLATMSHELRTPLNSIIGFTGILLQRLGGPLNAEQEKQLTMVYNSARHLLDLINDILDLSKIEAEQLNVVCEEFNLRESLDKVIRSSQPLADKKGLDLSVSIAPDVVSVKSDRRRIEQILLNLLSNAIKFTEQGFVRLDAGREGDHVVLAVSDSGIGVKPEDMDLLFNAFRQIESGITRKYEGTGLGLSICRKLTHLLGGEITVESIWGKGSIFKVILPLEGEKI